LSSITVGSTAALNSALMSAHDGDTILLQAGAYNGVTVNNLSFANGITITSADPAHQAVLTNFDMHNDSGITFSNLEFNAQAPGYFVFGFSNLTNVHFDHLSVHGSLDGNPVGDAEGFAISGSTNVSVTNSEFQQLERAAAISTSSNVTFSNNNVHDVVTTGVMFAQDANVTINNNLFSNFYPEAGDHPDAIQFITAGSTAPSHDITITNNVIYRGAGAATQGIFFADQLTTMEYQNVTIANNLIDGTGYGGIAVDHTHGLTVAGNTLISNPGDANKTWIIIGASDTVSVTNNQAVVIGIDNSTNLTQSGNVINTAVTDRGIGALHDWVVRHPEFAARIGLIAPSALPVAVPQTPIPPTDQTFSLHINLNFMQNGWSVDV
jgi:parallel beta-helix repeat protein